MLRHSISSCRNAAFENFPHRLDAVADNLSVEKIRSLGVPAVLPLSGSADTAEVQSKATQGEVGLGKTPWSRPTNTAALGRHPSANAAVQGAERGTRPQHGAPLRTASDLERAIEAELPAGLAAQLRAVFGHEGVLGSRGVLSPLGALGRHLHNPTFWMNAFGSWRGLAEALTSFKGPGSEAGSLGDFGPRSAFAQTFLKPLLGQLGVDLAKGGRYAVLGPDGPLGAVAGLGYLGPNGGTGYVLDPSGNFVDQNGEVQRDTTVRYQGRAQVHALYELYTENKAAGMKNNDASWMVRGQLDHQDSDGDRFHFTVKAGKHLTVLAVPERAGERYGVELLDKRGRVIARSDSDNLVNWAHLPFKKDTEVSVRILRRPDQRRFEPLGAAIDALLYPLVATGEAFAPFAQAAGWPVDRIEPNRYRLYVTSA